MLFALLPGFSLHSYWKEQGDAKVTAEGRAGGQCMGKGGLNCISHLHVSCALDGGTGALPVPATAGVFPGQSYRVCRHLEGAEEAGKAARGLQCGLCRSRYFLRSTSVFPQKVSGLPVIKYHPLTKSHSPLASEPLTLFFRPNVEEKWCLSPVPPINPFVSELALAWVGQHAVCSLATVPTPAPA